MNSGNSEVVAGEGGPPAGHDGKLFRYDEKI